MKIIETLLTEKKRVLIAVLALLVVGFAVLSAFVMLFPPSHFDLHVSEEIQERNSHWLDAVMVGISWFGTLPASVFVIGVTAVLFFLFRFKREALFVLLASLSGVVSALLKVLINRPRPTADLVKIIETAKRQSFPSGHTLFYTVFFGFLVLVMANCKTIPRWLRLLVSVISLLLVFLVPFSRIYLGAHWFTDVLGGFILGILGLFALGYFYLSVRRNASGKT